MLGVVGDNIYITWSPRYDTSGSYKTYFRCRLFSRVRRYCRALGANTRLSRLTVSASALSLCRLFGLEISRRFFFQGWDGKGWIANILTTGLYRLSLAMNVKGILAYHTFRLTKVLARTTGVSISWGFRRVFGCKR